MRRAELECRRLLEERVGKRSLRRLASLSAVGAGAAFLTADRAEASAIQYSGGMNVQVGWFAGAVYGSHTWTLQTSRGPFQFKDFLRSYLSRTRWLGLYGMAAVDFARSGTFLKTFGAGQTWTTSQPYVRTAVAAVRRSGGTLYALGSFSHRFALFEFNDAGTEKFGWIELSLSVSTTAGIDDALGPGMTVEGWAYDTTGAKIEAGDTGVPEPPSFALTGLAALALGAAGTRRWRAARRLADRSL